MLRKSIVYTAVAVLSLSLPALAQQKKEEPAKKSDPAKAGEQTGPPGKSQPGKDAPVPKKEEAKPAPPAKEAAVVLSGTTMDVSKKSIKIKDAAGMELEFQITPKTAIKKGKETLKAGEIKKGDSVEITAKGKDAEAIALLPPPPPPVQIVKVGGNVEEIDLKGKTIKLKETTGKVAVFKLTDKTVIKAGESPRKPEDIKKGERVDVEAKGDILETISLPAPVEILLKAKGAVDDVDSKAKIIKVKDDKGMVFSFDVSDKTEIKMGKDPKKFSDIRKGDIVEVQGKGKAAQSIAFESLSSVAAKAIEDATREIESARKGGAETLASEMFDESVGLMKKAQEEVKKEKFEWAINDAKSSKERAGQALQMTTGVMDVLKK